MKNLYHLIFNLFNLGAALSLVSEQMHKRPMYGYKERNVRAIHKY